MVKRIDFDMFAQKKSETVNAGVLTKELSDLVSNDLQLDSVIKLIEPNKTIFWHSEGNWSMHEMLVALLNVTGPADVMISSYAMSETPARILARLRNENIITGLSLVIDNRVDVRSAGSHQLMKSVCDKLVLTRTHAKVTVIQNPYWKMAVIGSANYTENERHEAGVITLSENAIDLQINWMMKTLKDALDG